MLVRAAPAQLEIWSRDRAGAPESLRAVVVGYSAVRVGDVSRGTALAIHVVGDGDEIEGAFTPAI